MGKATHRIELLVVALGLVGLGLLLFDNHGQFASRVTRAEGTVQTQPVSTPVSAQIDGIPDQPDFNWDVRPILSENCFRCHGTDGAARKASLRLDDPTVALAELKEDRGKFAFVPGHPEKSEALRRISSTDDKVRMPPPELHKIVSPRDRAIVTRWIEQGAKYKPHWAFIPPTKVAPPQTKFANRVVNPIDRFVFARLEREGLSPSSEADKNTLINRVTLALTGLPPTEQEIDAFQKDSSPKAYERVVDRLLASPSYGERMGAYWLDVARWSETDGFLDDIGGRLLWPWRDWMISAFNRNMPYDQFATWQLAGDLIPNHTQEQLLATVFGRLGKRSTENGNIDEEYRIEYTLDRANTVGAAFMGLTVGCARCHDHKYDPISQKDYYALSGFFNSIDEPGFYAPGTGGITVGPTMAWTDKETDAKLADLKATIQSRETDYNAAQKGAIAAASPAVDTLLLQPPDQIKAAIQKSIDDATVAYYPFDTTYPIAPSKMPKFKQTNPPREVTPQLVGKSDPPWVVLNAPPPAGRGGYGGAPPFPQGGASPDAKANAQSAGRKGNGESTPGAQAAPKDTPAGSKAQALPAGAPPAAEAAKGKSDKPTTFAGFKGLFANSPLPGDWVAEDMVFSPNETTPDSPAILQKALLKPGIKGNALWFDDTNKGTLSDQVGYFDRSRQFGFDVWIYLAKVYEKGSIFNEREDEGGGGAGYQLNVDNNILHFDLIHSRPYNMVSIASKMPLPVRKWIHVSITYDGSSRAAGLKMYLNGELTPVEVRKDQLTATILAKGGGAFDPWDGFLFGNRQKNPSVPGGAIDELRIFKRALTPIEVRYLHKEESAVKGDPELLRSQLVEMEAANDSHVAQARDLLAQARDAENVLASRIPQIMVMADQPKTRPTYVLLRGLYDQRGDEVKPAGLKAVMPWNDAYPRNRLGLAKWLFDPKNPLTSRVTVNRLWQLDFGRGLVETSDDFGVQGSIPTHPELLDWLAVEFVQSHWDIKHMQKLIVMSATFRESSNITNEEMQKDPRDLFLERAMRVRLPAEMVRDSALADGGLLVDKIGGPSVYPYQADGVWQGGFVPNGGYPSPSRDHLDDLHRRSIYSYVKRNVPPPSMMVFDMNDRSYCTVKVGTSNTPLQALVLMDDPQFVEAYRGMATRAIHASSDKTEEIKLVYRLAVRRNPTSEEAKIMQEYYEQETTRFMRSKSDADKFLSVGIQPVGPGIDHVQLAALTSVAEAVMNTPDAYTTH